MYKKKKKKKEGVFEGNFLGGDIRERPNKKWVRERETCSDRSDDDDKEGLARNCVSMWVSL